MYFILMTIIIKLLFFATSCIMSIQLLQNMLLIGHDHKNLQVLLRESVPKLVLNKFQC